MGEDFPAAAICGDNWWSSSRSMLVAVGGLSPCSAGINDLTWPPADDFSDTKPKSAINPDHNNHSMLFQDYSTFPNMGFAHWNQTDDLISGGVRGEISNFNSNGFEEMKNPMNFSCDSSSMTGFKQGNNQDHDFNLLEQNRLNSISCSTLYGYPSTKLLQSLYNEQQQPPPPQAHSFFNSSPSINTNSTFPTNPNDLSLSSSSNFISNYMKSSLPNPPQPLSSGLHFTNNTPFWNAPKSQNSSLALKPMNNGNCEDGQDQPKKGDKNSVTNESAPVFKRPRIETPSPLPTFKVRKEKLGDRVTALQQLVSPFGKTDTASVLHEAIEYIKFLHDQVSVLSTPYMKNNNGIAPIQHQQVSEKVDLDCPKQDLRSRGLCLVPISSTFPVTNTTTTDFWTPAFGGAFQ